MDELVEIQLERTRWRIAGLIGAGGGGRVFAASSTLSHRAAAKFIELEPTVPRELTFGSQPENARNVVPVIDQGRTNSHWVIVMPRAETSLDKAIRRLEAPMPLDHSLPILEDIAATLHDLYGRVVHRDVKPANVLYLDGHWQLTDFGIARYHEASTATHTKKAAFSREYAGPERWRDEHATSATDVYSWGMIAYELLSGEPPFLGPTREDYRKQHLHATPLPLINVPEALAALVEECMYKDPASRPRSTDLLSRLHGVLTERSAGFARLDTARRWDARSRADKQTRKSVWRSEKQRKDQLERDARASFRRLSNMLWEALTHEGSQPDHGFSDELGWSLVLGCARLTLTHPRPGKKSAFAALADTPPSVAAHAKIDLALRSTNTDYAGRAHSLWYCNAGDPDLYRWHELAFMYRGFPRRISAHMPFALDPDEESRRVVSRPSERFALFDEPFVLDHRTVLEFADRWARWLAAGAQGSLSFPTRREA